MWVAVLREGMGHTRGVRGASRHGEGAWAGAGGNVGSYLWKARWAGQVSTLAAR